MTGSTQGRTHVVQLSLQLLPERAARQQLLISLGEKRRKPRGFPSASFGSAHLDFYEEVDHKAWCSEFLGEGPSGHGGVRREAGAFAAHVHVHVLTETKPLVLTVSLRTEEKPMPIDPIPDAQDFDPATLIVRLSETIAACVSAIDPVVDRIVEVVREMECAAGKEHEAIWRSERP